MNATPKQLIELINYETSTQMLKFSSLLIKYSTFLFLENMTQIK